MSKRSGRKKSVFNDKRTYKVKILMLTDKHYLSPWAIYEEIKDQLQVNLSKSTFKECVEELKESGYLKEFITYARRGHFELTPKAQEEVMYLAYKYDETLETLLRINNRMAEILP